MKQDVASSVKLVMTTLPPFAMAEGRNGGLDARIAEFDRLETPGDPASPAILHMGAVVSR